MNFFDITQPLRDDPAASLITSWYFWSLVSLVLIVFGCIILSFTLSSLKRKPSMTTLQANLGGNTAGLGSAWLGLVSGSVNLGHLASTTVDSRSGIIQPNIQYREKKVSGKRPLTGLHNEDTSDTAVENSNTEQEWIENHLKPLSAAYKSVTQNNGPDLHLSNGQSILPPGFINTWKKKNKNST